MITTFANYSKKSIHLILELVFISKVYTVWERLCMNYSDKRNHPQKMPSDSYITFLVWLGKDWEERTDQFIPSQKPERFRDRVASPCQVLCQSNWSGAIWGSGKVFHRVSYLHWLKFFPSTNKAHCALSVCFKVPHWNVRNKSLFLLVAKTYLLEKKSPKSANREKQKAHAKALQGWLRVSEVARVV